MDEMGTNTSLYPRYAYSPKGRRAHSQVPRNRGKNTTLLASMTIGGMGPCVAVDGPLPQRSLRRTWSRSSCQPYAPVRW